MCKQIENNEQNYSCIEFNTSNLQISGKKTGKLMFKFDNDESQECATILDYSKITIELQQLKEENIHGDIMLQVTPSIEFTSRDGKKFKLFIEKC